MAEVATTQGYSPLHLASLPGGPCSVCGALWPCASERTALLQEYRDARSSLVIYLCLQLIEALERNPVDVAAELYSRYLGWVPPPETSGDPTPRTSCESAAQQDSRHAVHAA